jgi:hypothetical protein
MVVMARPVPTSIRLDLELKAALEDAAAADGRSLANMIDRILRAWLEERARKPVNPGKRKAPAGD